LGVVELPLRLDWSEQGRYDLSDERQRVEDLRTFVHGPTLPRAWRQLWLPRKVRTLLPEPAQGGLNRDGSVSPPFGSDSVGAAQV
jgi:hypothetical protein